MSAAHAEILPQIEQRPRSKRENISDVNYFTVDRQGRWHSTDGNPALHRGGHMQMHQIRYFLALCEELNFTRAARRSGVSQPSLTNAIGALERELGGVLF